MRLAENYVDVEELVCSLALAIIASRKGHATV